MKQLFFGLLIAGVVTSFASEETSALEVTLTPGQGAAQQTMRVFDTVRPPTATELTPLM